MTRVDIATGIAFDEFVAALETAAPPFDRATVERIVAAGGKRRRWQCGVHHGPA
jgi:hypothetical protein